jgi:hypothetical protein
LGIGLTQFFVGLNVRPGNLSFWILRCEGEDGDRIKTVVSLFITMAFFRQYIAPLFIVLIFLVALLAVSIRAFLPTDMAQPAPIEAIDAQPPQVSQTLSPFAAYA